MSESEDFIDDVEDDINDPSFGLDDQDDDSESVSEYSNYEEDFGNISDIESTTTTNSSLLPFPVTNYTQDITDTVVQHQYANDENAIVLNKKMQDTLLLLKAHLKRLLHKLQYKYMKNECFLKKLGRTEAYCDVGIRFCGAPFFKDKNKFSPPLNPDYTYRKKHLNELFWLDIPWHEKHSWTREDTVNLFSGVKCQVVQYIIQKLPEVAEELAVFKGCTLPKNELQLHNILIPIRIVDLLAKVKDFPFEIDWYAVSALVGGRHYANQCYAMWQDYLRPGLKRSEWSEEESMQLMRASRLYDFQNWDEIARHINRRSAYQCHLHYQTKLRPKFEEKTSRFSPEEDQLLVSAVKTHNHGGIVNWNKVCSYFSDRSKKQLYSRYLHALDPQINHSPFTKEEDCVLMAAVEEYGENFKCFPRSLFPTRSMHQVRQRYHNALKNNTLKNFWTPEDDKLLLEQVNLHGCSNWVEIAKIYNGSHTRIACRQRYTVISRYLKYHPNASITDIPRKNRKITTDVTKDNWVDKIIELKLNKFVDAEKPSKRPIKKYEKFTDRLRSIQREYYRPLKYSYDIEFGVEENAPYDITNNLQYLFSFFGITCTSTEFMIAKTKNHFTDRQIPIMQNALRYRKYRLYHRESKFLPTNWNTILGLRSMTILANDDQYEKNYHTIDYRKTEALLKFKKMFFKTFYQTAIISRIDPSNLNLQKDRVYEIKIVNDPKKTVRKMVEDPKETYTDDEDDETEWIESQEQITNERVLKQMKIESHTTNKTYTNNSKCKRRKITKD